MGGLRTPITDAQIGTGDNFLGVTETQRGAIKSLTPKLQFKRGTATIKTDRRCEKPQLH
jgi:hypothetical protein